MKRNTHIINKLPRPNNCNDERDMLTAEEWQKTTASRDAILALDYSRTAA